MPSDTETLGFVVLEAMASGVFPYDILITSCKSVVYSDMNLY